MYRPQPVDLKISPAHWRFDLYLVAFFLAHQGLADWRNGRYQAVVGVAFFGRGKFVSDFLFFFQIIKNNPRSIGYAVGRDL